MQEIRTTTELSAIRSAWEKVFQGSDPFEWPFQEKFSMGRVFYPTDGYHLTRRQFFAVKEALKQIGSLGFFVFVVESEGLLFLERNWGHWTCDDPSYEEYFALPLVLENAIYSGDGQWGILISHEMHALISGSPEFLVALAGHYHGWSDDLRLLREAWMSNPNADWLQPILSRMAPV
jgi:hypothetical protein